jgi:hypothetical protein
MKNSNRKTRQLAGAIVLALTLTTAGTPLLAASRPIADFLQSQGYWDAFGGQYVSDPTYGTWFFDWADPDYDWVNIDFLGDVANALKRYWGFDLDTTVDGSVTERPLPDGRAEVSVIVHAHNALTVAGYNGPDGFFLEFGYWPWEIVPIWGGMDYPPSLGDSTLELKFINTKPGAPLPDFTQLCWAPEPGQQQISCSITVQAKGTLRESFGVPEGTPGMVHTRQTGLIAVQGKLLNRHPDSPSRVALDAFPAEKIFMQVAGK